MSIKEYSAKIFQRTVLTALITLLLLLLWIPSALDKLLHFEQFAADIARQPFSDRVAAVLTYAIPVLEVLVVVLLVMVPPHFHPEGQRRDGVIWRFWRCTPYLLSTLLLLAFTIYVGMAWKGAWEKLPCGCGKLISWMSWQQHFWFNVVFWTISVAGMIMQFIQPRRYVESYVAAAENNSIPSHRLQKE